MQYMADPTLARELSVALRISYTLSPAEFFIDPEWLNCHWGHPECFAMLVDIADLYDCYPDPLTEFLEYCWRHQLLDWHHFIPTEMELELEQRVYAQFAREGPTDDVLESIHFLGVRPAYEEIVWDLISHAVQVPAPHHIALALWRVHGPLPDRHVTIGALTMLEELMAGDNALLQGDALRVVGGLKMSQVAPMLGSIALLAHTRTHARRIILGMGCHRRYAARVASAVNQHGWHDYLLGGHHRMMYGLLDMLQDNGQWSVFLGLYKDEPDTAVALGIFTRILAMGIRFEDSEFMALVVARPCLWRYSTPTSVHTAVHYMYYQGQVPPFASYFYEALQLYPAVVDSISARAPLVRKAVRWAHMKLLVCCIAASPVKDAKRAKRDDNVLLALARHPESWPVVVGLLY